ncbi:hypothetical protein LQ759_09620 [Serratia marcescens]|nr:hypothetical protein [Serratia marcescens]
MDKKLNELRHLTPRQIAVYRDRVAISDSDYELIPVHTGDLRALLAELEDERASREQWQQNCTRTEERIAELESKTAMTMGVGSGNGNLFVHGDYDSIKAAQAIVLENESLRAKLATPVRLPVVLMGYQSDDYRIGFMEGVEKSGEEVRAAGFTVEGDE